MLLHEIGQALFGSQWQSDLARELSVNVRTVQRWAAGEIIPPNGVYIEILDLAKQRRDELGPIIQKLEQITNGQSI